MLALWPGVAVAADAIVVIANAELTGLEEATLPVLRQLFLGRRSQLADHRIRCFEPAPGTPLRRAFARLVLELSDRDLERYWLEQALSGGPPPPREIADDADLVRHVSQRRGAIAYLGWESFQRLPQAGVKLIRLRDGDRSLAPGDPDYPLQFAPPQAVDPDDRNDGG